MKQRIIKFADKVRSAKLLIAASSKMKVKDFSIYKKNPVVSEELFEAHIGLYEGYVKAYNNILDQLDIERNSEGNYSYSYYSELKRRLSVPYNGAVLHELYFAHLKSFIGDQKEPKDARFKDLIKEKWGTARKYKEDVKNTALAAGNGWVVTYYIPDRGLENALVTEHHIGHLVYGTPIMVFDMFEHAYSVDYSTKKAEYVDKFLDNLDFELMELRLPKP